MMGWQDFPILPTQRHPRPWDSKDCPVLPTQRQPWALRLGPWALGPMINQLNSNYYYFSLFLLMSEYARNARFYKHFSDSLQFIDVFPILEISTIIIIISFYLFL